MHREGPTVHRVEEMHSLYEGKLPLDLYLIFHKKVTPDGLKSDLNVKKHTHTQKT